MDDGLNPPPPQPRVFYHVACMNAWRAVVREQVRLLAFAGLGDVSASVLGDDPDAAVVRGMAADAGVTLTVDYQRPDLNQYELPTLMRLHAAAKRMPADAPVLYLHTKGVSRYGDAARVAWRRLMQRHVVANWRANVALLNDADLVGVNWRDGREFTHFSGNVWLARAGWVAGLQSPHLYRLGRPDLLWGGEPWQQRMFAETWIGSQPNARVVSLACRNANFGTGGEVFAFDTTIAGFAYDD